MTAALMNPPPRKIPENEPSIGAPEGDAKATPSPPPGGARTEEPRSADQLLPIVYAQLRALAQKHLAGERTDHTLQATALVHEAYLRLVQNDRVDWKTRGQFYVAAAEAMRRVLIDHARRSSTAKRGGEWNRVTLNLADLAAGKGLSELLTIDEALEELSVLEPRSAEVVRLRFFGGLSVDETALTLGISSRSVDREWQYARAWLRKRLSGDLEEGIGAEDPGNA